ncbi:MAG: sulfotransferase domain-containing protein [Chloroflexi bacterium]|nr:sulfotransferase domain-containing protein [Chloroflexota bacterium]MBI3733221.1 sulfotransferase domain-containing protein [Chloroflexota bacterium]
MGNIYWLASYPKSGNTWMRILLTNYLRNADQPADINSLDGGPIASARQAFDDHVGIEASDLTQDEIERYRPFVYEQMSAQAKEALYLKVHDAFTYTPYGYPLISKAATAGVIYILRNPLDVAVSFAHHSASSVERMVRKMGEADFAFVDKPQRLHNQLRQKLLTWGGHVTSWVDEPGLRVRVIRYEELHADTVAAFSRVIHFCGLDDDPARIAKAVQFSRFEQAQKQEAEHGFGEKMPGAESFFRKGQVGSWRAELTPELVEKLIADHAPVMRRFGYLNESAELRY